jgi:hypothetical protein
MQVRLDIGEKKWLVFEDYGEKRKYLKVSIEDGEGASITLGVCLKDEFKRAGRSA